MEDSAIKIRQSISLELKKEVLDAFENGQTNKSELARKFKIQRNSVHRILNDKEAIIAAISNGRSGKRSRIRSPKYEKVEQILLQWFNQTKRKNNLTGPLIKKKAKEIANNLGFDVFTASDGWLSRFKGRHSIFLKSVQKDEPDVSEKDFQGDYCEKDIAERIFSVEEILEEEDKKRKINIQEFSVEESEEDYNALEFETPKIIKKVISLNEAIQAMNTLEAYFEQNCPDGLQLFKKFETTFSKTQQYCGYQEEMMKEEGESIIIGDDFFPND